PEQIDGRPIEGRSDIFALGAVLYEMVTGTRAFAGQSSSAIAAAILHSEPAPISSSMRNIPKAFDQLVRTCLEKDPDRRWESAHDVALQLAAIGAGSDQLHTAPTQSNHWVRWLGWAVAIIAATVAGWVLTGTARTPGTMERVEFEIAPPSGTKFSYDVETVKYAVSPDGRALAMIALDATGVRRIWMRQLSSVDSTPVAGTEGATAVFWAPDSHKIAFFAGDTLKRLDLTTGAAVAICKVPQGIGLTGTWNKQGEILFASVQGDAIFRVSTAGGQPKPELKPDPARNEVRSSYPAFLPDGNHFLYSSRHRDGTTTLMLGASNKEPQPIAPVDSNAQFVEPATLVYVREGVLVAQHFDPATGRISGEPSAIAKQVRFFLSSGLADFATSPSGTVVYQSHGDLARAAWVDRGGREISSIGSIGESFRVRISPQQQSALVSRALKSTGTYHVWSLDFQRGTETRLTLDDRFTEVAGVLTRDEQTMYYGLGGAGPPRLMRMDLRSGRSERLMPFEPHLQEAEDISPDGTLLAYSERNDGGLSNLWTYSLNGSGAATPLRKSPANEEGLRFSPDGRHYSFVSNESGRNEVYVAALDGGAKIPVSAGGGYQPRWSGDGRTLFYISYDHRLMAAPVRSGEAFDIGKPTTLFEIAGRDWVDYDVSRDGLRFLALIPEAAVSEAPLTAVQHWDAKR
ncbi:MAG: hypothetical protein ABI983_07565, partial [Acidobacteriota bacterium]